MDMAVQAFIATTDESIKSDERKMSFSANHPDFKDCYEDKKNTLENTVSKKSQKIDILLTQLLNLFNMNIFTENLEIIDDCQTHCMEANLLNVNKETQITSDKLAQLWQQILSEFETSGHIKLDTVNKFYIELKTEFPNMPDLALHAFHDQISKILVNNENALDHEFTEEIRAPNNTLTQVHQPVEDNEIANDQFIKQDIKVLKPGREDNLNDDLVSRWYKRTFEKNHTVYDNSQDLWSVSVNNSNSPFQRISSLIEKPFIVQSDLVVANTTSNQGESLQSLDFIDQIVDKVHTAIKGDTQQVSIRLKPEHLGDVLIKVYADKDNVKAQLFVENTQVRDMMKVHVHDFRNQIMQQGYNISEISVYKLSEGMEMGAFNHQFNSNSNHNQSKRSGVSFNRQEIDNHEMTVKNYYDQWDNMSSVNYVV